MAEGITVPFKNHLFPVSVFEVSMMVSTFIPMTVTIGLAGFIQKERVTSGAALN